MKARLKKIIEYGLYLSAFLLPIQTRLFLRLGDVDGYNEYTTISLYGIDILIIIILFLNVYIVLKTLSSNNYNIESIWWLIAGLDFFIFISILFSHDWILSFYRYSLFLLGVGLFWLISSVSYSKIKLIYSFLLGLMLQSAFAIWQFLYQTDLQSKWLGIAMHNVYDLGVSVIEIFNGERWLRSYGGFDHPNILGGVMATGLLLILSLLIKSEYQKYKETEKAQTINYKQEFFLILIYSLFFIALLFSFSRSAWLSFILAVILLGSFYLLKKDYVSLRIIFKYIFVSIILSSVVFSFYPDLFKTRIIGEARLEIKSSQERISSLEESMEIIKNNLFFGSGIGNYVLEVKKEYSYPYFWDYRPVHNTFLLVLSEIGLFGFLFFVAIILFIIKLNYQNKNFVNLVILFSILIMMFFDHWWWSLHFGILYFWFLLGMMYNDVKDI